MTGIPYLTWRYLRHRPLKSLLLTLAVALMIFLPLGVRIFVEESTRVLQDRAVTTPLLIGPKGSAIDLTLASLYFLPQQLEPLKYLTHKQTRALRHGTAIPLHTRFTAGDAPLVGTSLNYFEQRGLEVSDGRLFTRLGDCVLGAEIAARRGLKVGDHVISSPENVFDLAGTYPLKMRVTGILEAGHSPDDSAIFIDLKTAWIIEGIAHGHEDLAAPAAADAVLETEGDNIKANASLREFTEVTDDNIASFHFHGNENDYPITSVLVFPDSEKSRSLLLGRYETSRATAQIVIPAESVRQLLDTLFSTKDLVFYGFLALAVASGIMLLIIFSLSLRLREAELSTYGKIGVSPVRLLAIKIADLMVIVIAGALLAAAALTVTKSLAETVIPRLL